MATERATPVKVVEHYREFVPRLDYKRKISEVLESLPSETVAGLGAVVLRDTPSLTRQERKYRARTKRGRAPLFELLGSYRPADGKQPACIELYMDNILSHWPPWIRRVPVMRYEVVHATLFHELGHHAQASPRNVKEQSEFRAEAVASQLKKASFRKRHRLLLPLVVATYRVGVALLDLLRIPHGRSRSRSNR